MAETGLLAAKINQLADGLDKVGRLVRFDDLMLSKVIVEALRDRMSASVEQFHKSNPLVQGISKEQLRETLGLRQEAFRGVLEALVRDRKLEVNGEIVHAAGKGVALRDEEAVSKAQIERAFAAAGLRCRC